MINHTQRGKKCFVLQYLIVEPVAVLFWAFGIGYLHTTVPARRASMAPPLYIVSISFYGHANCTAVESWCNSHRRRVAPPPFPI